MRKPALPVREVGIVEKGDPECRHDLHWKRRSKPLQANERKVTTDLFCRGCQLRVRWHSVVWMYRDGELPADPVEWLASLGAE